MEAWLLRTSQKTCSRLDATHPGSDTVEGLLRALTGAQVMGAADGHAGLGGFPCLGDDLTGET